MSSPFTSDGSRSRRSTPGGVNLIAALTAAVASLAAGFAVATLGISTGAALASATAIVLAAPLVVRASKGTFDLFEPITAFCLTYFVLFVLRPAYMLAEGIDFFQIGIEVAYIGGTFTKMQVAGLIGAIGFIAGYEFGPARRLAARVPGLRAIDGSAIGIGGAVILAMAALGTVLYVFSLPGGFQSILAGRSELYYREVASTSGYLYYAPTTLVPASLLLLAGWAKTRRPSFLLLSLAGAALLLAVRGPVGGRLTLLPLFAGAIIFFYLFKGTRPRAMTVAVAFVVGLMAWTLIGEARNESSRSAIGSETPLNRLLDDPARALDPITEGQDAAMAPGLAAAMTVVPKEMPYQYGLGTIGDIAARGVPRAVWPEKPVPPREKVITTLWGNGYLRNTANPEFSVLFSWYADAGMIGIALGMALYGLLFRAAGEYLRRFRTRILVILAYAIFLASIPMLLRDGPIDSLVRMAFGIGPIILLGLLARRSRAG